MHKNVPVSPVSSCYIALTAMPVSTNIGYEKGTKCCICLIFISLMYNRYRYGLVTQYVNIFKLCRNFYHIKSAFNV